MADEPADTFAAADQGDPTLRTLALAQREIKGLRELLEKAIAGEVMLLAERIAGLEKLIVQRFLDQDRATAAALAAAEKATDAALAAADRASAKTEANVAEQIRQLGVTATEVAKRFDDRFTAVETRVSKTEAVVGG